MRSLMVVMAGRARIPRGEKLQVVMGGRARIPRGEKCRWSWVAGPGFPGARSAGGHGW